MEKREPVEYHGANETIVQEAKEERALKGSADSTIQVKYIKKPDLRCRESKPPIPPVRHQATVPAQRPSPVNTKLAPPLPRVPTRPIASPPLSAARKPVMSFDNIGSLYLPEIPSQRPSNSSNLTVGVEEW